MAYVVNISTVVYVHVTLRLRRCSDSSKYSSRISYAELVEKERKSERDRVCVRVCKRRREKNRDRQNEKRIFWSTIYR